MGINRMVVAATDRLTAESTPTAVARHRGQVIVTGAGDLVHAVTSVLARNQVIAAELRVEQASLDDAFVAPDRSSPRHLFLREPIAYAWCVA